jgi:hypothetical protein
MIFLKAGAGGGWMLTRQDVARDTFYVDRDDADPNRRCRQ